MTGYRRACTTAGCDKPDYALRRCKRHYERYRDLRNKLGATAPVPAEQVAKHAQLLRWRGWVWADIAVQGRLARPALMAVVAGEVPTVRRDKADLILAVEPVWQHTKVSVPIVGTRRRLDALAWQGWTVRRVADEVGIPVKRILDGLSRKTLAAVVAAQVADFYDVHAYRLGPDPVQAKRARTRRCLPAWVWDEDGSIEDPATQPAGRVRPGSRRVAS